MVGTTVVKIIKKLSKTIGKATYVQCVDMLRSACCWPNSEYHEAGIVSCRGKFVDARDCSFIKGNNGQLAFNINSWHNIS